MTASDSRTAAADKPAAAQDPRPAATAAPSPAATPSDKAAQARRIALLRGIVIGLGVLNVLAFLALVAGIFIKGAGKSQPPGQVLPETIAVPAGTTLEAISASRGELALALRHPDGNLEILVIDTRRGRLLQRLRLAPTAAR